MIGTLRPGRRTRKRPVPRLARKTLERKRHEDGPGSRLHRQRSARCACWVSGTCARPVIPGHTKIPYVPARSWPRSSSGFVRKIEQRSSSTSSVQRARSPLPSRRKRFEKRRGDSTKPDAIDVRGEPEIDLEAARRLCARDGEDSSLTTTRARRRGTRRYATSRPDASYSRRCVQAAAPRSEVALPGPSIARTSGLRSRQQVDVGIRRFGPGAEGVTTRCERIVDALAIDASVRETASANRAGSLMEPQLPSDIGFGLHERSAGSAARRSRTA